MRFLRGRIITVKEDQRCFYCGKKIGKGERARMIKPKYFPAEYYHLDCPAIYIVVRSYAARVI